MDFSQILSWWERGERAFLDALDGMTDDDLDGPSLLPDWSRRTVVAHVARNADALVNLLTWARTGVETPMYASREARDQGIVDTAVLGADELRADCHEATGRLVDAVHGLPEFAWANEVRTAQGGVVPGFEVPWMRCREVWVHLVDLNAGLGFAEAPPDFLVALVGDVIQLWSRRGEVPPVMLTDGERTWGSGPVTVVGEIADVAGWVTGRQDAFRLHAEESIPELPRWI